MHTFVWFGSVGEGLTKPDLLTRLYQLAITFDLENQRPKADEINVQTMQAMTLCLTKSQMKTIRKLAQEKIYNPLRTSYMDLDLDILEYIRPHAEETNYSNVVGNPAYEVAMEQVAKKLDKLRDSISSSMTAIVFTHKMSKLYRRTGGSKYDECLLLLRNVILCRYIVDHPNTVWVEEDLDDTTAQLDTPSISTTENGEWPAKKQRTLKASAGGCDPKGQDFWSLIDA
ncbi:hypothetical protein F5876DRAFT_84831 [Lentinula aff. lateritia]|uniref:Uncharacterized protein n=1 Tax=Lentinula aff. lateritia TaxID=2804960 RepID=A0ACC1TGF0_9AGAR|nr:hypothetical protein F5876DRAFT_84831 [Lentinula aff. lateritia]